MVKSQRTSHSKKARHVAIFVDSTGNYGRGLLEGIADYVDSHVPWSLFIEPKATGRFAPAWLHRWHGDGVLAFIEDPHVAAKLRELNIPTVETYGHVLDLRLPWVGNDDDAIGRMGARHFLERQFEHFAFSGYPSQSWVRQRRTGFVAALKEAGHECVCRNHPRAFSTLKTWEQSQQRLARWLQSLPKPVGLMACSDRHARNVLDACHRAGILVPDEVAVLGTDNDESICRLLNPPLSSVADNPRRIGYEAAALLDQIMAATVKPSQVKPRLIPPKGIVTRRSTDMMVTEDKEVAEALHFIREHAHENVDVNTLLRELSVSRSTLYRRFQKAVGRSPHEQIVHVRLERVKEMLTQTSLPLSAIALRCGFEYTEYLVAVFKQKIGMTPGQYRKAHRPLSKTS